MKTSPALHQFAWLFTRDDESVRLQIHEQGDAFRLAVNGPGSAQAHHDFASMTTLMMFVADYQEQLQNHSFRLQASAERRASGGGRAAGGDRRRR
jgi:hypothetical protein